MRNLRYLVYCSIYFHRNDEICVVHGLLKGQKKVDNLNKKDMNMSRYEEKHDFVSYYLDNTNCAVIIAGLIQVETKSLQCVCVCVCA